MPENPSPPTPTPPCPVPPLEPLPPNPPPYPGRKCSRRPVGDARYVTQPHASHRESATLYFPTGNKKRSAGSTLAAQAASL